MSETKTKIRFRDGEANEITNEIEKWCAKYVYSEPFPIPDEYIEDMLADTIPPEVQAHIDAVVKYDSNIITTRYYGHFNVAKCAFDVDVTVSGPAYWVSTTNRLLTESSKYHPDVLEWVDETARRKLMVSRFHALVYSVFRVCNTPGQVKTVYPALVELLPERHQVALAESVRATRWPCGMGDRHEVEAKAKEFENMVVLLRMMGQNTAPSRKYILEIT